MVIDGDGSFQMTMQGPGITCRASTSSRSRCSSLNNRYLGMVRQWQELFYGKRYTATVMTNPNFAKVAEAFNCTGIEVRDPKDLDDAVRKMLATPGPVVMDVHVSREENVYPMVAVGRSLHEMTMGGMA